MLDSMEVYFLWDWILWTVHRRIFPESSTLRYCCIFKKFLLWNFGKTPSSRQSFFCFIFASYGGEYNVIVRDSEPIRLLESPRALSVYILVSNLKLSLNLALVGNEELCSSKSVFYTLLFIQNNSWIRTKLKHAYLYWCYVTFILDSAR